jgi:hypothetical protein
MNLLTFALWKFFHTKIYFMSNVVLPGKKEETKPNVTPQKTQVDIHKKAAKHHQEAAKHHEAAAKHHEIGDPAQAAVSTVKAYGHHSLAGECLKEDVKLSAAAE